MQQNVANENETGGASKCPTCRGKIEINKIIDYVTFRNVYMPDPTIAVDEEMTSENSDSSDDGEFHFESATIDVGIKGDLGCFIVSDDIETEDEKEFINSYDDGEAEQAQKNPNYMEEKKRRGKVRKGKKEFSSKQYIFIAILKKGLLNQLRGVENICDIFAGTSSL